MVKAHESVGLRLWSGTRLSGQDSGLKEKAPQSKKIATLRKDRCWIRKPPTLVTGIIVQNQAVDAVLVCLSHVTNGV